MKKPKLLLDARMIGPKSHGFARYVAALARGLSTLKLAYDPVFIVNRETPREKIHGFPWVVARASFLHPSEWIEIPKILRSQQASAYHSPTFASLPWAPCPWIVTIHDLNHLIYGGRKEKLYYRFVLKPFARRAAALATVSKFSQGEIARWLEVPRDRIDLAYNALDETFLKSIGKAQITEAVRHHGLIQDKYFLCVSNPKPHKNLGLLVHAYREYLKNAGSGAWPLLLTIDGHSDLPELRYLGNQVADAEVRALMEGAGAVAFPSLYEGFGLPPVEAAALGIPVIASRIPPHEEGLEPLAAKEILWASPRDAGEWVDCLRRAAKGEIHGASSATRAELLSRYNAERLGRDMDQIYRRVLGVKE